MKLRKGQYVTIERGKATQIAVIVDADREGARVAIRSWSDSSQAWSIEREILRRFVVGAPAEGDPRVKPARKALLEERANKEGGTP